MELHQGLVRDLTWTAAAGLSTPQAARVLRAGPWGAMSLLGAWLPVRKLPHAAITTFAVAGVLFVASVPAISA